MSGLLREIARGELDSQTRAAIEKCAINMSARFTVLEGSVTGAIRILFHNAHRPSKRAIRALMATELAALPREGMGALQ